MLHTFHILERSITTVENPAETVRLYIRLASHLVRAPNSRSGGHEFESPMRELGALTKNRNTLGVRSFYTTSICQRENSQGKHVNIALDDIQNLSGLTVYCHAILHMYSITCGRPLLVCNTVIHQFYRNFYLGMFAPAFTRKRKRTERLCSSYCYLYTLFNFSVHTPMAYIHRYTPISTFSSFHQLTHTRATN